jgi:hypothetical protein
MPIAASTRIADFMMSLPDAGTNGRAWKELYGFGAVIASGLSSGAEQSEEPGLHNPEPLDTDSFVVMDPGLATSSRPGMTATE